MPLHAPSRTPAPTPARARGRHRARHAAPGPASTPLTGLTEAVAARTAGVARRGGVVVASTGLVMTLGVTASSAEPLVEEPRPLPAPAATAPAERVEEPAVTGALTVAADVPVTFARSAAPAVTAPPPPPPPPAPVVAQEPADEADDEESSSAQDDDARAEASVSRSAERTAVDAEQSEDGSDEAGSDEAGSDDESSDEGGSDEGSSEEDSSEDDGSEDDGSEDESADEGGSEDEGSDDESSDDGGSQEEAGASSARSSVLDIAAQYVGTPYSYGGTTPSGFDCSGFTQYVFAQAGIDLPRTAAAQGAAGTRVSRSEAQPGDLAVVSDGSHIGIYAGDDQWYDSPRPGKSVSLRDIWTSDVYFVRY